jgi:hypothetical protein
MRLTDEQLTTFENLGYLHLPNVLGRDRVGGLLGALRVLMEGQEGTIEDTDRSWWENLHPPETPRGPVDRWECRNIVTKHPALLEVVDLPEIVVPIAQILGSNIALLASHALVRHRTRLNSAEVAAHPKAWHRRGHRCGLVPGAQGLTAGSARHASRRRAHGMSQGLRPA